MSDHNQDVSAHEYRYTTTIEDGTVIASRSDETLPIGSVETIIDSIGKTYKDEAMVEVDVREIITNLTLPRWVGDELRVASAEPSDNTNSVSPRLGILIGAVRTSLKYGLNRRANGNRM